MGVDADEGGRYFAADYEATQERERLRRLESMSDQSTIRAMETVGVGPGWHCLEVGAGGGSVARWLGGRVGPTGRVVAADLDPRFLDGLPALGIEVRRCDITRDEIEPDAYDLVHCRTMVLHMVDPPAVLSRMAAAVRPGGWLLSARTTRVPGCVEGDGAALRRAAADTRRRAGARGGRQYRHLQCGAGWKREVRVPDGDLPAGRRRHGLQRGRHRIGGGSGATRHDRPGIRLPLAGDGRGVGPQAGQCVWVTFQAGSGSG
ncbi:class I SAM-dependent methyltransferase [Mycobacterium sp. CBMA295]|nr:class I SAM-dependent methyltransferase [Mycolicibacterium sp. CBMA 295]